MHVCICCCLVFKYFRYFNSKLSGNSISNTLLLLDCVKFGWFTYEDNCYIMFFLIREIPAWCSNILHYLNGLVITAGAKCLFCCHQNKYK